MSESSASGRLVDQETRANSVLLTLPWPPSVNNYWLKTRTHVYISAKGRAYRERVIEEVANLGRFSGDVRLRVAITAFPPDRRRRDIDNLLKCTLDSLEHARVFTDDSQVDELYIERGEVTPGGALAIEIQSVST